MAPRHPWPIRGGHPPRSFTSSIVFPKQATRRTWNTKKAALDRGESKPSDGENAPSASALHPDVTAGILHYKYPDRFVIFIDYTLARIYAGRAAFPRVARIVPTWDIASRHAGRYLTRSASILLDCGTPNMVLRYSEVA